MIARRDSCEGLFARFGRSRRRSRQQPAQELFVEGNRPRGDDDVGAPKRPHDVDIVTVRVRSPRRARRRNGNATRYSLDRSMEPQREPAPSIAANGSRTGMKTGPADSKGTGRWDPFDRAVPALFKATALLEKRQPDPVVGQLCRSASSPPPAPGSPGTRSTRPPVWPGPATRLMRSATPSVEHDRAGRSAT